MHLWRIQLDVATLDAPDLLPLLSPDERARADRLRIPARRDAFVTCRGLLRCVLSRYLDVAPDRLRFRCGPSGKPVLEDATGPDALEFNLSHSAGIALLAVTRERAIGVDVERIDPRAPVERLAARYFSPREAAAIRALPEPDRPGAFFARWTCKEAFVKARGDRLRPALGRVEVSLEPDGSGAVLNVSGDPDASARWRAVRLAPADGYAAACVAEGHDWRLRCWAWAESGDPCRADIDR
ncbi:MAG TPA: 4'-phosphopantetheinyl transferase superfamily protein [Longimicrobiales bacterium]